MIRILIQLLYLEVQLWITRWTYQDKIIFPKLFKEIIVTAELAQGKLYMLTLIKAETVRNRRTNSHKNKWAAQRNTSTYLRAVAKIQTIQIALQALTK